MDYYLNDTNSSANDHFTKYTKAVQFATLAYISDLCDRTATSEQVDRIFSDFDGLFANYRSPLNFKESSIRALIDSFFSQTAFREIVISVWAHVGSSLSPDTVLTSHERLINSISAISPVIQNSHKTTPLILHVFEKDVLEMTMNDFPNRDLLNQAVSEFQWLFIPYMIANYCDLAAIEKYQAMRFIERSSRLLVNNNK